MAAYQHPVTGRTMNMDDVVLLASAARTTTTTGTGQATGNKGTARLFLNVTAGSGTTPTLDVAIQTSYDGSTNWVAIGTAFTQATGVTSQRKVYPGCDRYIRAVATIAGTTPSFTFSVDGELV